MKNLPINIDPTAAQAQTIELTDELIKVYGLDKWAQDFSLMTAGYRDRLDPADASNPEVPFNIVTVAVLALAKARVFRRKLSPGQTGHVHVGGETRPHTQTFIQIAARVYAANDFRVHLRKNLLTTPIWYTSFGVFYEGYQSGDNFTASHSQYFKGGWKPVDASGQQLLTEEAEIVKEVQAIVRKRESIQLGPWTPNPLIMHDFDVDAPYVAFQRSVLGEELIARINQAGRDGFKCSICTMGGSMKATSERLFAALGVPTGPGKVVDYYYGEESSDYHKIGQVGDQNYGVDPSSRRIYRSLRAQQKLLSGEAEIVLLWDPDGDRLNVVTKAPIAIQHEALAAGLEVDDEHASKSDCIVYFTPNQLYLMLAAFRIDFLRASGQLSARDWFIGLTYPTTQSLEELARAEGLGCVRVPVGFKYIGDLCRRIESQVNGGGEVVFETSIGEKVPLGRNPRALILCEESGGATLGGFEMLVGRNGGMLALREKDAMQLGLLSLCLAATLHQSRSSFAKYYCDLVGNKRLKFIHYSRKDAHLYDEALMGSALKLAKEEGFRKRDKVMDFFGQLVDERKAGRLSLEGVRKAINDLAPAGAFQLPPLTKACRAGDDLLHGMLFEAEELRFLVRPSGTDALLRYYVEATSAGAVKAFQSTLQLLKIA